MIQFILDNLIKRRDMVRVFKFIKMEEFIKVIGKMITDMEMDQKNINPEVCIKDNINQENHKEKENIFGNLDKFITVIGKMD